RKLTTGAAVAVPLVAAAVAAVWELDLEAPRTDPSSAAAANVIPSSAATSATRRPRTPVFGKPNLPLGTPSGCNRFRGWKLGGFGGMALVAGVRCSFPAENAGSVHIRRYGRD